VSEHATSSDPGRGNADEIICVRKPASAEEVDETAYLDANPDVRRAGMRARDHFIMFGQREGRLQWANQERVAEIREKKLRSLRFRHQPSVPRDYGQPVNFLSPETIAEFGIPESPPVSANQYGGAFIDEIRANPAHLGLDVGAGLRFSYLANITISAALRIDAFPSADSGGFDACRVADRELPRICAGREDGLVAVPYQQAQLVGE
jgi:hypothetical protein